MVKMFIRLLCCESSLLSNGEDLVPIPGTTRSSYVAENIGAIDIDLPKDVKEFIDKTIPVGTVVGDRYPANSMTLLNQ